MDIWEAITKDNEESRSTEFELSENDFIILSNIVIYNSILLYKKEIKKKRIPATFIKFYFNELSGYDYLFDEKLRQFFNRIESQETQLAVLMKTFAKSFPYFVIKEGVSNFIPYFETANAKIPEALLTPNNLDEYIKSSINSLKLAIDHYNNSDELRSVNYIFKDYLYNTYKADVPLDLLEQQQLTNEENNENAEKSEQTTFVELNNDKNEARKKSALLTGRQIEIPKQKGKVVSVLFPEIPLPSAYPTMKEKSRFNSLKHIRHFMTASEEIELINNYGFNQVKYSLDFVNKRKVIAKDLEKASRFDFKF